MSQAEHLKDLLRPAIEALDCELWGLEYFTQGNKSSLVIFIEREDGVGVEHCEQVSRQVSAILDVEDPITGEYRLEVSSPGWDRPLYTLEQFQRFVGEQVKVRLKVPMEGRRNFSGRLNGVEGDEVVVQVDDEEFLLPIETIDKANVVPKM
ncbi:MAG: ribosome maturation factor RimP [Cellvibrionaceae bacterium]